MKANYWNDNCYGSRMKSGTSSIEVWSQLELARELGTNQSTISRIEKGALSLEKSTRNKRIIKFIQHIANETI